MNGPLFMDFWPLALSFGGKNPLRDTRIYKKMHETHSTFIRNTAAPICLVLWKNKENRRQKIGFFEKICELSSKVVEKKAKKG